ncbi:MAG: DUF4124 domain-containing protein [Aeromonas sp.]
MPLAKYIALGVVLAALVSGAALAQGGKVYRWVDAQGKVHYGDMAPAGQAANEVDLRVAPNVGTQAPAAVAAVTAKPMKKTELSIELLQPQPKSTLRDNQGNVSFEGKINPLPTADYKVQLHLDGKMVAEGQNSMAFQVHNIDRGQHQAQLLLFDQQGVLVSQSASVTFFLHRAQTQPKRAPDPR